ncbi:hypothetical protein B0H13DRAFT_2268297 [Mycena leptocephala]|nr:hypothetical protein B0H13DRAFT_2268297 [Mycena leptocephala]
MSKKCSKSVGERCLYTLNLVSSVLQHIWASTMPHRDRERWVTLSITNTTVNVYTAANYFCSWVFLSAPTALLGRARRFRAPSKLYSESSWCVPVFCTMRRHRNFFNCATNSVTLPVYFILSRLDEFKGCAKPLHQTPSPAGACTPPFDPCSIRLPGYLGGLLSHGGGDVSAPSAVCCNTCYLESCRPPLAAGRVTMLLLFVLVQLYICNIMVSVLIWHEYGANTKQIDKKLQSNAAQKLANSGKSGHIWR